MTQTAGFFCRTYYKDADRLRYLLRSVELFAVGFEGITVACPPDSMEAIAPIVDEFSCARLIECGRTPNDFIGQQITKLTADRYAPYDLISHVDSDCVLTKTLAVSDLLKNGKPIMYMAPYSHFYEAGHNLPWQTVTSRFAKRQVDWEFMRQFPLSYPRESYHKLGAWFEQAHGYAIDSIDEYVHGDYFSEFNLLGAFSFYRDDNAHTFINVCEVAPLVWVRQFCEINSREDRTISNKEVLEMQEIFGTELTVMKGDESMSSDYSESLSPASAEVPPSASTMGEKKSVDKEPLSEMNAFKDARLWDGGFIDADPLEPVSWSSYTTNGFVSVYHAAYLACIKPYLKPGSTVLEIGPGRGAWTRALLDRGAEQVIALDVQRREDNGIDAFLGDLVEKLKYIVVRDFLVDEVHDDTIDFFWSFGTFVHLSKEAQQSYMVNVFKKLRPGSYGFIQCADLYQWNRIVQDPSTQIHVALSRAVSGEKGEILLNQLSKEPRVAPREPIETYVLDYNEVHPGRYFYVGRDWLAQMLQGVGFEVVDQSVIPSLRDPVVQFRKPL